MAEWYEWIEKIPKEWLPEWWPEVEEKEPSPFLGEWGSPKVAEGEWADIDTELSLQPKVIYKFVYDIEGDPVFWKDPEGLASDIRIELKREYGDLGDDFQVHYWKCDPVARTFEVQFERVPPFITTPPETAETGVAAAVVIIAGVVAIITTVIFGYLTLKTVLRNAQEFKEIVKEVTKVPEEVTKATAELYEKIKPFLYITAAGFFAALGASVLKQVIKSRERA